MSPCVEWRAVFHRKPFVLPLFAATFVLINFYTCAPAAGGAGRNVCRRFSDYSDLANNSNCWFNPDVAASPGNISRRYGFRFELHSLLTADGYNISLFRIGAPGAAGGRQAVLLHHGISSGAMCFMTAGNRSLAFHLAGAGFDVWLANARGSTYSSGHKFLPNWEHRYWDFSFHEMAMYDLPAALDYIANSRAAPPDRAIFIGHSMGSTVAFIYASLHQRHAARRLKGIVAVCPVTALAFLRPPLLPEAVPVAANAARLLLSMGAFAVLRSPQLRHLIQSICVTPPTIDLCRFLILAIVGKSPDELMPEDLPAILSVQPAPTSIKTIVHYLQVAEARQFRHFDHGPRRNAQIYNSTRPPAYNLQDIALPVHLFYGDNDPFAGQKDVVHIFQQLKTNVKSMTHISEDHLVPYNHMDFLYGKNVERYFYKPLMAKINQLLSIV